MGNQAGSLKKHIETAEKTGALNFTDKGLEKFPQELFKVSYWWFCSLLSFQLFVCRLKEILGI